jgi:transcriptional regulator with XRE-family HTH domain
MTERRAPASLRTILGANVRKAREDLGWSQERLAEAAGLTQVFISHIETSKTAASVDSLQKLAAALSCEPYELLRQ